MTQRTYRIGGLHCKGCVSYVTEEVAAAQGVSSPSLDLSSGKLTFESDDTYSEELLKQKIDSLGRYTFLPTERFFLHRRIQFYFTRYQALIGAFALVLLVTAIFDSFTPGTWQVGLNLFMGSYFLVFGLVKLINIRGFAKSYQKYDLLAERIPGYALLYPFIELTLAVIHLGGNPSLTVHLFTAVLMAQKAYSVHAVLKAGKNIQCACLGGFFTIPITWVTFWEDALMAAMALLVIFT